MGFTQSFAYTHASPALGTSSVWGSEMPPILGPATSIEMSDGSCGLGVACPDVVPEFTAGSLFPCADGRDHSEVCRLTLLAAR